MDGGGPTGAAGGRRATFPWVNVALFAATAATTILAGALLAGDPERAEEVLRPAALATGLPYAAAILGILAAHEMGHYLMARAWGVDTTLPYFVPSLPPVGTFGAVIRMRSPIPNRRALLDVGAAGPFAGFLVALPVLAWATAHSSYQRLPEGWLPRPTGNGAWSWAVAWLLDDRLPAPVAVHYGDSLVTAVVQRLVLGPPPPGHELVAHPVFMAAWFGLFVTTLNLLPLGQLDGGHVVYALLGRGGARAVSQVVSWGLFAAGLLVSWNWLLWWAVTRFALRLGHPPTLVDDAPLGRGRAALAMLALVLFAGTFIPIPVSM